MSHVGGWSGQYLVSGHAEASGVGGCGRLQRRPGSQGTQPMMDGGFNRKIQHFVTV